MYLGLFTESKGDLMHKIFGTNSEIFSKLHTVKSLVKYLLLFILSTSSLLFDFCKIWIFICFYVYFSFFKLLSIIQNIVWNKLYDVHLNSQWHHEKSKKKSSQIKGCTYIGDFTVSKRLCTYFAFNIQICLYFQYNF